MKLGVVSPAAFLALVLASSCGSGAQGRLVGISLDVHVSTSDRVVLAGGVVTRAEQNAAARAAMACLEDAGLTPRPTTEDDGRLTYHTVGKGLPGEGRKSFGQRVTAATDGCGNEHDRTVNAVYQADAFYGRDDRQTLLRCLRAAGLNLEPDTSHADVVLAVADAGHHRQSLQCLRRYSVGELRN